MEIIWIFLFILTFNAFIEQFERYVISVAEIPFIDYTSYGYSLISGPLFAVTYSIIGALGSLILTPWLYAHKNTFNLDITNNKLLFEKFNLWTMSLWLGVVTILYNICFFNIFWTTEFYQVAILRLLIGAFQSLNIPLSSALIKQYFTRESRGKAFGIYSMNAYIGIAATLSLGKYMNDEYGWKTVYIFFGIIGTITGLIIIIWLRDPIYDKRKSSFTSINNDNINNDNINNDLENINLQENDLDKPLLNNNNNNIDIVEEEIILYENTFIDLFKETMKAWGKSKGIITLLILATGVRFGIAYIWSYYMGPFFSPLWKTDDSLDNCIYSYNSTYIGSQICTSSYPYCVNNICKDLESTPWHNKGIDSHELESYMSCVPLLGAAVGSVIGGILGDRGIKKHIKNKYIKTKYCSYLCGLSNISALIFICSALYLPNPWCFLVLIPAGWFGEWYSGLSFTILTELVPSHLIIPSSSIFLLFTTLIGGNMVLLVPPFERLLNQHHIFKFTAGIPISSTSINEEEIIDYSISKEGSHGLQTSMFILSFTLYTLAGILYFLCGYVHKYYYNINKK